MKKPEKIFSTISLLVILLLCVYGYWRTKKINENYFYIIAKVYEIVDTENGNLYRFVYTVKNVRYSEGYKGTLLLKDSLFVLKVSAANPTLWSVAKAIVPDCNEQDSILKKEWTDVPVCQ